MNYKQALEKLEKYGQTHIFKFFDELDNDEREALISQIEATDMDILSCISHKDDMNRKGTISPLAAMELDEIAGNRERFKAIGTDAIKNGKVAAMLLAGGMGTRLGSDNPKGMYNIGISHDLYIFECLINNMLDVVKEVGCFFHLFIMTSEKNNEATINFLTENNFFGFDKNYVHFFSQEMAAATDYNGKIYMEGKGRIATSPNGNGGWYSSLKKAGLSSVINDNGIEWLNVFAVDNVLQRICDPVFIGATIDKKCTVGSKVVRKAAPDEKVGVMCLLDNKPSIVEYYELTPELMNAKNEKGEPAYNFGVILNYLFSVKELDEIVSKNLPLHIVEKKIPYIDDNGNLVKPEAVNGYKFEGLVLDMIHQMSSCLPFEVVREKEFAPIKNATGVDSVESARELLKKNGVAL